MHITPLQWLGIALMLAGALVYAWPRIRAMFPTSLQVDDLLSDGDHGPDVRLEALAPKILERLTYLEKFIIDLEAAMADDPTDDDLLDRMGRLAQLQADLEARGHLEEAKIAGTWYALLRDPIRDQEAPRP